VNLAKVSNAEGNLRVYGSHFQWIANGMRRAVGRDGGLDEDAVLVRFTYSPNQGIVKCLVVDGSETTREEQLVVAARLLAEPNPLRDGGDAALLLLAANLVNSIVSGRTLSKTERQ
jgi:hypothetical protein